MKTLKDFNFKNKRVLVRCDFNVPFDEKGRIGDDFRIKQSLPTIEYLKKKGAKIILISHLGRPKGKEKKYSLKPVSLRLEELLELKVHRAHNGLSALVKFLDDCLGEKVKEEIENMKAGEVFLLENLRFYEEEEQNKENFAKALSELADIYINDGFGACHRAHASVAGIPKYLPSGAGFLLEKEVKILSKVLENPWRPLIMVIGGVKISTKIKVIENFLKTADHLLLGGEIANAVLELKGILIGKGLPESSEVMRKIEKINLTNPRLHLPIDGVISLADVERGLEEGYIRQSAPGIVKREEGFYDIGPETIKIFSEIIKEAKMIIWSGPLGMYEKEQFEKGTKEIAKTIARNYSAFKIVGGGDLISALNKFNLLDKFDHVSTGGGAMLEFLSGEKLPGIEALSK